MDKVYRISTTPEKVDRTEVETISQDSTKILKNNADNKLVISFPKTNALYPGYWNLMQIGFRDKKTKKLRIECEGCDTLFQSLNPLTSAALSHRVVAASNTDEIIIRAYTKKNKLLSETIIPVVPLPAPIVFLDDHDAQSILTSVPERIHLKYHPSVPLNARFHVVEWSITINQTEFKGVGNNLPAKVQDFIHSERKGTIILNLIYAGPFGKSPLKEIIEFNVN